MQTTGNARARRSLAIVGSLMPRTSRALAMLSSLGISGVVIIMSLTIDPFRGAAVS